LFGPRNAHLRYLAGRSGLNLSSRGATLRLSGDAKTRSRMSNLLTQMYGLLKAGLALHPRDLEHAYAALERNPSDDLKNIFRDTVFIASPRKTITPKTVNQREYVAALRSSEMTFAVGPAGTGKTYLAVAMALAFLLDKRVKRLVLTRPAVEAGERLGFLPGDMAQKVDPYLRPLYDALHDMLDFGRVTEMQATGVIEIAPLAFMRGRTLTDAFVILDEAQNATPEQMKMFLTRMGFGSRVVVTGDITQIDLPDLNGKPRSGLIHALNVLRGMDGISIQHFQQEDVLRHPLVGRIVAAYDAHEKHS
jgi:phosphate starvation-inducible PhoH-like protein